MFPSRTIVSIFPGAMSALAAFAQQPAPTSAVKTVEVKASVTEAEVGQQVKLGPKIDKGSTTAPGQ